MLSLYSAQVAQDDACQITTSSTSGESLVFPHHVHGDSLVFPKMSASKGLKAMQQVISFLAKEKGFDRHISKVNMPGYVNIVSSEAYIRTICCLGTVSLTLVSKDIR